MITPIRGRKHTMPQMAINKNMIRNDNPDKGTETSRVLNGDYSVFKD